MTSSGPLPSTVLATVDSLAPPHTPVTTTEVAAEFDCPPQTVAERLETLTDEEVLETRTVGDEMQLWWRPPGERRQSEISHSDVDVTTEMDRQQEREVLSAAIEASIDGVAILDDNGEYIFVNQAHADTYGYDDPDSFLGETWHMCYDADETDRLQEDVVSTLYEEGSWRGEVVGQRKDGTTFPQELSLTLIDGGGIVCVVRDITDRKEHEQMLRHRREQLAELNSINEVIQGITTAVIDQSTREEIETIVCERLAAAESYEFAWIGEVDPQSEAILPRAEAGVEGYLEDVSLSANADSLGGQGPAGTAIRTGEMQVTRDALANPEFEPWHEYAERYGYRSMAAIPIVYGSFYGLLGIYASQPHAFDDEVRPVIAQLGEIVGHAIAATERQQALMSPEITEIQISVPNLLRDIGIDPDHDGAITVDRAVALGDGDFLEYGRVDADAIDTLRTLVEQRPHLEAVTITNESSAQPSFELQLSEQPILSVVASYGGDLEQMTIENGSLQMTLHLPPAVPVRRIVDQIRDQYPTVELLTRRQITRHEKSSERTHRTLTDDLTERQRAALETAVHSGFFEWPRDVSGQEMANKLDVAPATFHQHLRRAQQQIFESLFLSTPLERN